MIAHLEKHQLLPPHQSAYPLGHSVETAVTKVLSDLISSLDKGELGLLVLLDLSAAFDTVDHAILLTRLESSFDLTDRALSWIRSYLDNRSQTVFFNGKTSSRFNVPHGVPQGSVLGPVLFVLYTADIGSITHRHDLLSHFYADDSQLYLSCRQNSIQCDNTEIKLMQQLNRRLDGF